MQSRQRRLFAAYALGGLMLTLAVVSGAFLLVWCGLVRFLFSGWLGMLLVPFLAFIAWRSYTAARAAWRLLPEAPPGAIAALVAIQVLVVIDQVQARLAGEVRGIGLAALIPHAILAGLMAVIFFISPSFDGHMLEHDLPFEDEFEAPPDQDDDDMMYLGGA